MALDPIKKPLRIYSEAELAVLATILSNYVHATSSNPPSVGCGSKARTTFIVFSLLLRCILHWPTRTLCGSIHSSLILKACGVLFWVKFTHVYQ